MLRYRTQGIPLCDGQHLQFLIVKKGRLRERKSVKSEPGQVQPNLVLPQENSDEHPLLRKYAKISEQALKSSSPGEEDDSSDSVEPRVG